MSRTQKRPPAEQERQLETQRKTCIACGQSMWVACHNERTILTLHGFIRLKLVIRRCRNRLCSRYRKWYRPEEEGRLALPHGECGLDVIAFIGTLRYRDHLSVKEIHQQLLNRSVPLCERTVEHAMHRYEELVAAHQGNRERLHACFKDQKEALLAIDGLQPDVGHEVLWVIRELLSGEIILARPLLSSTQDDLAALLTEAANALPVPVCGVVSDGQLSIRSAVKMAFPEIPHQLCQFHYVREAAKPIYEADRHAKKELKKQVRGIRAIERSLEEETGAEGQAMRDYTLAVRSSLTDDGHAPLEASGLKLHDRLTHISASLEKIAEKGGFPNLLHN